MAVIKTIEKGESLTFGFVLPETYNLDNLQAVKIYIGSSIYGHEMDGRTVRVELESNQTALITGRNIVHFVIDDAVFGIKKINCGELEVLPTQATHKDESVNTGYDVEIVLSINVETVSIESVLYDTLKGDKGDAGTIEVGTVTTGDAGTDVIVENVGTPSEAVLNFTIPRGSAGDFFSGDYNLIINKQDCVWVDGWLWIDTGSKTALKIINVGYMAISTGIGAEQLKPIVHYPAALTYQTSSIPNGFYLKDEDGRLSENVDFEFIDVRYNILSDITSKYDGLTKLIGGNAAFDDFDVSHSAAMRTIFLQIYQGFTGEVHQSKTDELCNFSRIDAHFEPTYARIRNVDVIGIPIVNAGAIEQTGSNADILKVASHYNNTFARVDITADANTFINNVIAIGSCPDEEIPTTGTSYGFGLEFFEDTIKTSSEYPNFNYAAWNPTYQQSATTAIITAKFRMIKDATGASWDIIRRACRATARKTVGGVYAAGFPWDMYRGFGVIDVDAAIDYIKANYTENDDYLNSLADEVERTRGIDPMLPYDKQTDNTPIAKRDFEPVRDKLAGIEDNANNYVHPATHPPAIIEQDANNRFVTDAEKSTWDGKQNNLGFTPENAANKQNSLAVDGTGAKYPTVDTLNANFRSYTPTIPYANRILTDSGVISDLEKLTKLYIENLKLLDNTVFLWDGSAGIKTRTSGANTYATKLYDMSAGNRDAVQATEANQPHISGLIAPNEQRKLKGLTGETGTKGVTGTDIQIASSGAFTLAIAVKWNYPRTSSRIYLSDTNYIELTASAITLRGDSGNVLTCAHAFRAGLTENLTFEYNNGAGLIRANGVEKTTTATSGAVTFGSLFLNQTSYNFDGEICKLQIANVRLSAAQIQNLYNFTRLQHPEIEGIAIGNQFWATSNYEGVVTGDGTVIPEVQDNAAWAALTPPAWCYYNNDPLNGAVYGKLYNWYAVQSIAANPPAGWRVPTNADWTQLANYLRGAAIAGGKTKKEGVSYFNTPNTAATNESGLSIIGSGVRSGINGSFSELKISAYLGTTSNVRYRLGNNISELSYGTFSNQVGRSLRLIRNEPVGGNERTIETGYITNALGVTNLDISIPFGYQVESIRFDSETDITGLSAKLLTGALVELETLFTAKSVTANIQKVIAADADQSIQQTDAVVRINGTKADTTKRFRVWIKLTKVVFS